IYESFIPTQLDELSYRFSQHQNNVVRILYLIPSNIVNHTFNATIKSIFEYNIDDLVTDDIETFKIPVVKVVDLYRHDQLEDGYGIEWIGGGNEDEHQQQPETISVRSVQTNCEHLPTQIRRSLSKILPGDVVVELNGVSTVNMGMREFIKNLKLSGSRVRIRLKSV
ncbi:unnamed protein product, partial [Didymodactylos carnosus]